MNADRTQGVNPGQLVLLARNVYIRTRPTRAVPDFSESALTADRCLALVVALADDESGSVAYPWSLVLTDTGALGWVRLDIVAIARQRLLGWP